MPSDRFTISADCTDGARQATRLSPSSALVLAERWASAGCKNVRLADPTGTLVKPDLLRAQLFNAKRLAPWLR